MINIQSNISVRSNLATLEACTPKAMHDAQVPLKLARWYHTVGRNRGALTKKEVYAVLQVRLMVSRLSLPRIASCAAA